MPRSTACELVVESSELMAGPPPPSFVALLLEEFMDVPAACPEVVVVLVFPTVTAAVPGFPVAVVLELVFLLYSGKAGILKGGRLLVAVL